MMASPQQLRACQLSLMLMFLTWSHILAGPDIRIPPSITHQTHGQVLFQQNDTITLECEGEGFPHPTFTWLFNNTLLDLTEDHIRVEYPGQKGTLTMAPTADDLGEYVCQATNPSGTAITDIMSVRMAFNGEPVPAPKQTPVLNVVEGQQAKLDCKGFTPFYPPAQTNWQKTKDNNSVGLDISDNIKYGYDESLYIASVTPEDEGMYGCFGLNPFTQGLEGGHNIQLKVTQKNNPTAQPPTLAYATQGPVLVNKEDMVTLKCVFYGHPTPTIIWQKDGEVIEIEEDNYNYDNYDADGYDYDYDHNKHSIFDGGSALTIDLFEESDEGRYSCVGENSAGRLVQDIGVHIALTYESEDVQPININVSVGETVRVPCKASGYPDVDQIVWMVNGKPINDKSQRQGHLAKIQVERDTLVIPDVCKTCPDGGSDVMVIQCVSLNSRSRVFAQGYVNVLEQSFISKPPKDVILEGPGLATFSCEGMADPSTPVTYTWQFNGHVLENFDSAVLSVGPFIMINETHFALNKADDINSEHFSYFGEYTCVVSNNYTSVSASATLSGPAIKQTLGQDQMSKLTFMGTIGIAAGGTVSLLFTSLLLALIFKRLRNGKKKIRDLESDSE